MHTRQTCMTTRSDSSPCPAPIPTPLSGTACHPLLIAHAPLGPIGSRQSILGCTQAWGLGMDSRDWGDWEQVRGGGGHKNFLEKLLQSEEVLKGPPG